MSKVLIVHPKDSSTSFLDIVYTPIENKTVVTERVKKSDLIDMINDHDQVMMMGHGSPMGLFSVGRFRTDNGLIIDQNMVEALSKKDNSIFIWCNADQFVNRYQLKGFYTGMFISEVGEAYYCGLPGTQQDEVDVSNFEFVKILGRIINEPVDKIYNTVVDKYGQLIENSPVAKYNHERLYLRG